MTRKKVILTLSRVFPQTHSKKGINTLFAVNLFAGRKIHTIRTDRSYGSSVLRILTRGASSYVCVIKNFVQVGLQHITMTYGADDKLPQAWVDGKSVPIETLAKNDGLRVEDFVEFFFGTKQYNNNVFEGVILHFTDFRY